MPVPSPDKGGGLTGACYTVVKNATNTMEMDRTMNIHTGSVVARVNKDRVAAFGTRSCNEKFTTESQRTTLKMKFTVGVWNVRSLWQAGAYVMLKKELERFRYDVIGLCEVRWTGSGELENGKLIWSGTEKEHIHGVGMFLGEKARLALIEYNPINERVMYARFKGYPRDIDVIVAYAPTTDYSDAEVETFYEQLEQTLKILPKKDVKIIVGDWNAKIGNNNIGLEEVMGKYGIGDRNERGERLLEFVKDQRMYVANTRRQNSKKWTWESPDGKTMNMIDLVLIEQKWMKFVTQCRAFPSAEIGSDHRLVLCNVIMKITKKLKMGKDIEKVRYNTEMIKKKMGDIRNEIEHELDVTTNYDMKTRVSNLETALKAAGESCKIKKNIVKPWISDETWKLVEERRRLKVTKRQGEENKMKYKEVCQKIKKSARADKRRWINGKCENVEKLIGENKTREAYQLVRQLKGKLRNTSRIIRDRNGNILTESKQIKDRWTEYIKDLFTDKNTYKKETLEVLRDRKIVNEEESEITTEEITRAMNKMKNNKSTGKDDIPIELIRAGGPVVCKEIHKICQEIWDSGKWPEEWCKSVLVMLPKKGDLKDCNNYRSIALIPHICKIMLIIIKERLEKIIEQHLSEEQAGFRKDRSTIQQILMLRLLMEDAKSSGQTIYHCFVDFKKAFDSVWHEGLWATLDSMGASVKMVKVLKGLYEESKMAVRTGTELGDWIKASIGSRQGDPTSPLLFIALLERAMENMENSELGIDIGSRTLKDLRFADDIDLLASSAGGLQRLIELTHDGGKDHGLHINIDKTKVMITGEYRDNAEFQIDSEKLELVDQFVYLGSLITSDNNCTKEIDRRIAIAHGMFTSLKEIWKSGNLSTKTKLRMIESCVFPTLLYACETWTIKKRNKDRLEAFEMGCYRKLLGISWRQKVRNETIRNQLGKQKSVYDKVRERKLGLFGHICRMTDDRLIKRVLMRKRDWKRKVGRPAKKWIDDITEWTGVGILSSIKMAKDRKGVWKRHA